MGIKSIERAIIDRAWSEGWVTPQPPPFRTGKRVAVIGSGPAGLAAAQQLARAGHGVTVFEKNDRVGGLLRYGIPDFKMEKYLIERRVEQMQAEGVTFHCNVHVGHDLSARKLERDYDAVLLAGGAFWWFVSPASMDGQVLLLVVLVVMAVEMAMGFGVTTAIFRARDVDLTDSATDLHG